MIAALLFACHGTIEAMDLEGVEVEEAWLEDFGFGAAGLIGGGLAGDGTMVVKDPYGTEHRQYVEMQGGFAGCCIALLSSFTKAKVELYVPDKGTPVYGEDLLGRYRGSFESFTPVGGVSALSLQNDLNVKLDLVTASFFVGFTVSGATVTFSAAEDPADAYDTADTGDSGDGDDTADTGDTADTADSGDDGDTSDSADTGSAPPGDDTAG